MNWAKGRPKIRKDWQCFCIAYNNKYMHTECDRDVITTCIKYLHKMKALSQDMLLGKIKILVGPCLLGRNMHSLESITLDIVVACMLWTQIRRSLSTSK